MEVCPKLFEAFYRLERSLTRETGAGVLGLGLFLVSTAVQACGGTQNALLHAKGGFGIVIESPNRS